MMLATEVQICGENNAITRTYAGSVGAGLEQVAAVEPRPYAVGWRSVAVPVEDPASALTAARERLGEVDDRPVEVAYGAIGGIA